MSLGSIGLLAITIAWILQLTRSTRKLQLGRQFVLLYGLGTVLMFVNELPYGFSIDTWLYLLTLIVLVTLLIQSSK